MKKLLFTTVLALLCLGLYAQNTDEDAIKKACIAQHDAWMQRNITALAAINAQVPYSSRYWATKDGWIGAVNGSEQINKVYADVIGKNPMPRMATIERTNWQLKSLGANYYWATFDFVSTGGDGKVNRQKEARLLEKMGGEWKMVSVITLPSPN